MKFREKLFQKSKDTWMEYLKHPFIVGMIDGTLKKEKYKEYLVQDYLYLKEYAKVFCMGIVKSKDMDEMRFLYKSIAGTMEEGASHIKDMEELGISEKAAENSKVFSENLNYTNYMVSIGLKGDVKEIAIATIPCTWSYNFIGSYMKEVRENENPLFDSFINLYGGEEYTKFTIEWLDYVDSICTSLTEEEEENLLEIFDKCSKYELDFWNMAWNYDEELKG